MAGLTTSRENVLFVVPSAGATTFVLPIGTERLVVLGEEQFAMYVLGGGLMLSVPSGSGVAFDDSV